MPLVQCLRQLAGPVGAEVEEDDAVSVAPGPRRRRAWADELVRLATLVGGPDSGLAGVGLELGLALDDRVVGQLRAVPATVAVHRVVATADGGDTCPAPGLHLGQVAGAGVGMSVAAVGEGVNHHVRHLRPPSQLHQRLQVLHAGVHPARRHEPQQVEPLGVAGGPEDLVVEERAILDCLVDPEQVLLDDRSRPQIEVAHLRVAHLALGQPHRGAPCGERGVRIAVPQVVEHGRVGLLDRVARTGLGQAPAVQHDQADPIGTHGEAAATIRANPSGSRLAPPTSAPSTSGCCSSSPALSGLTLPP